MIKKYPFGDSIAIKDSTCKISELMIENNNIKTSKTGQVITIGRIKGNLKPGDKIYKTASILLNKEIEQTWNKENIKRPIDCKMVIEENKPISIYVKDNITGVVVEKTGAIPKKADNAGITAERIKEQLSKLGNTVFKIEDLRIKLEEKLIIPISNINEIRRESIIQLEKNILKTFIRKNKNTIPKIANEEIKYTQNPEVSICLNNMSETLKYEKIQEVDNIYIPLRFFINPTLKKQIQTLTSKFNVYLLMPAISKSNYEKINMQEVLKNDIKGVVISNLSQIEQFKNYTKIANYTLNISNNYTIKALKDYGITKYIVSPEFEKDAIKSLNYNLPKEVIVYGKTLLMTTEYCVIGTYKNCKGTCKEGKYKLKDRMGFEFPIITDRINCNNMIYNSKTTSIEWKDLKVNSIRIDILDENIEEINKIIKTHKNANRLEGKNYTNGNLNRKI